MNVIETMKQALEALHLRRNQGVSEAYSQMAEEAITNLRNAIQQAETVEPRVFDDWPEYHAEAMGCGMEDRGITDCYEAMRYGWEEAVERIAERLEGFTNTAPVTPEGEYTLQDWGICKGKLSQLTVVKTSEREFKFYLDGVAVELKQAASAPEES